MSDPVVSVGGVDIARRVVVVTGGGSGLGAVVVTAFRVLGARVLAVDLAPGADVLVADVTTDTGRAAVVEAAGSLGGVDVLVHNAGGWSRGGAQYPEAGPAAWRAAVELDLLAPMALTQDCLPQLRDGGGAVVNVASSAGVETAAYGSPEYGAAKAGLIRFTTSVADWRERYGVRVNCVVPGWIGLPRAHEQLATLPSAERAATPALVPPGDVAAQVVRLAGDDALAGRVVTMLRGDEAPVLLP